MELDRLQRAKFKSATRKAADRKAVRSIKLPASRGRIVRYVLLVTILCFSGAIVLWVIR